MYYLLVFHGNDGYANVTKYYVCMYSATVVLSNCNQPQIEFGIIGKSLYICINTDTHSGVPRGVWGSVDSNPFHRNSEGPPKYVKINPIVKIVKNC